MTDTTEKTMPTMQLPSEIIESMKKAIRAALMQELALDADAVTKAKNQRAQIITAAGELQQKLDRLRAAIRENSDQLHEVNAFLGKFENLDAVVDERFDFSMAAMTGQALPKKAHAAKSGTASTRKTASNTAGYVISYAFDGTPRKFTDLTKLTYALGMNVLKLGHAIALDDLRAAFKSEAGYDLFGSEHHGQTVTFDVQGIAVTIGMSAQ